MKVSDYVVQELKRQGVTRVFEMIGGAIAHLIDSLHAAEGIECVSMHHEQAAAFAAEGHARVSGTLGVAMATSGPGALNLLTGIGSCFFDSVPALFLTGQVNTYEYKQDRPVRQLGFQETDIVAVAGPLVKYAEMVSDPSRVRYSLEKAVYLAFHGRPGPVLLDLPNNVQRAEIDPGSEEGFIGSAEHLALESAAPAGMYRQAEHVLALLKQAQRPLILAGGGVRISDAGAFRAFAEATGVPVVHSLMGLDALPAGHPLSIGMIGSYGHRYANLAVANCDFLLVLGSRLDTRQTGTRPDSFARDAVIVHVDVEPAELNHKVKADYAVHADLRSFMRLLREEATVQSRKGNKPGELEQVPSYGEWKSYIADKKTRYLCGIAETPGRYSDPNRFMERLSSVSGEGDIIVLDVGQNQMWASQSFGLKEGQRLLNAGGMGAMGFALPAAIGAALAKAGPGGRVIVVTGDGGIQVNLQELHTIAARKLPVHIYVLNNNSLGMVRQFQNMYMGGRNGSTVQGYGCPDLVSVGSAFGIRSLRLKQSGTSEHALADLMKWKGPLLVDVPVSSSADVLPKLTVNHPVEEMTPPLPEEEWIDAMLVDRWKREEE